MGRVFPEQTAAPAISGLTPEQQQIINHSWTEGKASKTMDQAAKFLTENQQNVSLLNDALRSSTLVTSDDESMPGEIERSLAILEREGNFAAGRGAVLSNIPGTSARELAGSLETIKSAVSFDKLLQIKKSGAGLGALSDSELGLLGSSIANLHISQHPDVLAANLGRVRTIYGKARSAIQADLARLKGPGTSPVDTARVGQQNLDPLGLLGGR